MLWLLCLYESSGVGRCDFMQRKGCWIIINWSKVSDTQKHDQDLDPLRQWNHLLLGKLSQIHTFCLETAPFSR